jgi:hypothetical protein
MPENCAGHLAEILLAQSLAPSRDINVFAVGGRC